jgi:hypothetical protein
MQQIKKWTVDEELLHEHGETVKECAEHAAANKISLRFADMSFANMRSADMSFADMRSADMSFADMSFANMSFANMRFADMRSADMRFADMRSADMRSADMSSADIENTSFVHSDMRFCNRDENAKLAHLNVFEWPVSIQFDGIHIGCKRFSLEEILAMTEEIAATYNSKAPVRWRRWGKAIQALAQATLG